jgi:hypothetical protein
MMYVLKYVNGMSTFINLWCSIQVIQQLRESTLLLYCYQLSQRNKHDLYFKYDILVMVWYKKGMILMGVNGNLPFLPSNNRKRSSLQYMACENTQNNGQCPQQAVFTVTCHQPKPSYLDKKTLIDYLQTKLCGAS